MQRTTQRGIKLLDLSVVGADVLEMLVPEITLSANTTKLNRKKVFFYIYIYIYIKNALVLYYQPSINFGFIAP